MRLNNQQIGAVRGLKQYNQFTIFIEAIETEYQQAIKDLIVSDRERTQWQQGRVTVLKNILEEVAAAK